MSLKKNLVKYMKENRITIRELAKATDISEPTLKKLRTREDSNPTLDVLIKISTALGVSISGLVQDSSHIHTVIQGTTFEIPEDITEFTFIFTKDTFSFAEGAKALFKKYSGDATVTKYILNSEGNIFEKISNKEMIFRDEKYDNFSVDESFIFAYIVKEIYEVNYV